MERLYRVSEVTIMLNVSAITVRKWIKINKLGARRIGKPWTGRIYGKCSQKCSVQVDKKVYRRGGK